jgi:hypothetical protein
MKTSLPNEVKGMARTSRLYPPVGTERFLSRPILRPRFEPVNHQITNVWSSEDAAYDSGDDAFNVARKCQGTGEAVEHSRQALAIKPGYFDAI